MSTEGYSRHTIDALGEFILDLSNQSKYIYSLFTNINKVLIYYQFSQLCG